MTIKELENRTGMTRANIRYYENEGLLAPKRLDNGYRDYSEEDARTLEKIKLLRQLQLDLETIRKVQQGTLTLDQALFVQTTKLEGDKAVIERAAEVCRELERSGVEYGALDPQPYLWRLEAPPHPVLPNPPPPTPNEMPDNTPRACWCPWQRLFARSLDMVLYRTIFGWLWAVLTWNQSFLLAAGLFSWLLGLALLAFTLAVEPLWLHFLGWTPGKLLFGLKLRNKDGEKLTIAQGWERSWRVFQDGCGYNIPLWGEWKMWKCREMGLEGRDCWWDAEEDYRYTKVERRFSAGMVYVLVALACAGALWMTKELTDLPRNRGDLTVAEFSQNYNLFYDRFSKLGVFSVPRLDSEGRWEDEEDRDAAISHTSRSITEDGVTYTIENPVEGTTVWSQPEFIMEDGRITAVTLRWESQDSIIIDSVDLREGFALMAMSGASREATLFNYDQTKWFFALWDLPYFENQEMDYQGLHISQQVDYEGYILVGSRGALWTEDENATNHFEKMVTISLPEP